MNAELEVSQRLSAQVLVGSQPFYGMVVEGLDLTRPQGEVRATLRRLKTPRRVTLDFIPINTSVQKAVTQKLNALVDRSREDAFPVLFGEFLSERDFKLLEDCEVGGLDMSGNSILPLSKDFLLVKRVSDARPAANEPSSDEQRKVNPYRGRMSLVSRLLLERRKWPAAARIVDEITDRGYDFGASRTSRTLASLKDDRIVTILDREVILTDPGRLLDEMVSSWRRYKKARESAESRVYFRRKDAAYTGPEALLEKFSNLEIRICITGEGSAAHWASETPRQVTPYFVNDLEKAKSLVLQAGCTPAPSAALADFSLSKFESDEVYFGTSAPAPSMRPLPYASLVQTYIELACGDARQAESAEICRRKIIAQLEKNEPSR